MEKQMKLMNQLVADLAVNFVKFHNLHWNVVGERFKEVHEYAEELYDMINEQYDEVAERMKMLGSFPAAQLKTYLELSNVEEIEDRDYQIPEVFKILKEELEKLRDLGTEIRTLADDSGDFATVAMLEDMIIAYDKEIWFMEQALK